MHPHTRPLVSLVVPADDVAEHVEALAELHRELAGAHPALRFELVLVDDGCGDDTTERLLAATRSEQTVRVATLARTCGTYAALCAGLAVARGDGVLVLDAVRPGSAATIGRVLAAWRAGHDVVWVGPAPPRGRLRTALRRLPGLPSLPAGSVFVGPHVLVDRSVLDRSVLDRSVLDTVQGVEHGVGYAHDVVTSIGRAGERQTALVVDPPAGPERSVGARIRHVLGWLVGLYSVPFLLLSVVGLGVAAVGFVVGLGLVAHAVVGNAKDWALVMAAVLFVGGLNLAALGGLGEYLWRTGGPRERPGRLLSGVRDHGPAPARPPTSPDVGGR